MCVQNYKVFNKFYTRYQPHKDVHQNDLALIRLKRNIPFSSDMLPICLPKSARFPDTSGTVYVAGWGILHEHDCTTNEHVIMNTFLWQNIYDPCIVFRALIRFPSASFHSYTAICPFKNVQGFLLLPSIVECVMIYVVNIRLALVFLTRNMLE